MAQKILHTGTGGTSGCYYTTSRSPIRLEATTKKFFGPELQVENFVAAAASPIFVPKVAML